MGAVTSHSAVIPTGRPFTVADLEAMPDDGNRYEIIDGMLIVSPAPVWEHQEMLIAGGILLRTACPRNLRVIMAPFAVQTAFDSEVQPDIIVARYTDLRSKHLPVAPVMVGEVLSRSTALHDHNTKKAHYERMGVQIYWLLDPIEPGALTVFELDGDGRYQQVAHVEGDETHEAHRPFPVTVVPARLLDGLRPWRAKTDHGRELPARPAPLHPRRHVPGALSHVWRSNSNQRPPRALSGWNARYA